MASRGNFIVTVAIDFGTTFSGYSFSFSATKDKIIANSNWAGGVGSTAFKVPTCVLINEHHQFVAFGFDAQNQYRNSTQGDDDTDSDNSDDEAPKVKTYKPKLYFYDEFKMKLQGEQATSKNLKLSSVDGHECSASMIFVMALTFLKDHLLGSIGKYTEQVPKQDEIRWVLTVPAIWSDGAKMFMRKCAVEAGIVKKEKSDDQLFIALEPEAASLYCRELDIGEFRVKQNLPKASSQKGLPKNTHYLVVDCGGGTVDITAHHYKEGGELCELYAASGGGWGGRNINSEFEAILCEVVGGEAWEAFKMEYPVAYLDMKVKFEMAKRAIDFEEKDGKPPQYIFDGGFSFFGICESMHKKKIHKIVKENESTHGVIFSNGKLKLPRQVLLRIFKPTVDRIKNHLTELLRYPELQKVKYLYLVGGFSDCSFLQKEIKEEFRRKPGLKEKDIQIVLAPYEASLAIVKGAVMFGYNPQAISSRRARRFYCTSKTVPFQQHHDRSKQVRTISGLCCKDVLVPVVKQNEEIFHDDVRYTSFRPFFDGNTFKLYHYKIDPDDKPKTLVKYATDKEVYKSVLEVDLSKLFTNPSCTKDTSISIYLYFGSTELHIAARNDKTSGQMLMQTISCAEH